MIENKRLGHVLRIVKAQRDIRHAPTVQTNSGKGGYQKRGPTALRPDYYHSDKELIAPPAEAVEMPV